MLSHHLRRAVVGNKILFIRDSFNGPLDNDISGRLPDVVDNGNTWVKDAAFSSDIGVDGSGVATWVFSVGSVGSYGIDTLESDVLIDANVVHIAANNVADVFVVARLNIASGLIADSVVAVVEADNNILSLRQYIGSVLFTIGNVPFNPVENSPYNLTLSVIGTKAIVTADNSTILTGTITDSPHKGVGLLLRGSGLPYSKCHDFKVYKVK